MIHLKCQLQSNSENHEQIIFVFKQGINAFIVDIGIWLKFSFNSSDQVPF